VKEINSAAMMEGLALINSVPPQSRGELGMLSGRDLLKTHFVYIDSTFRLGMPVKDNPAAKLLQSIIGRSEIPQRWDQSRADSHLTRIPQLNLRALERGANLE
jgi:hypothetical protein